MQRFLISNPKFNAAADIVYNAAGLLINIDLSNCGMDEVQTTYFKKIVPTVIEVLLNNHPFSADTKIIPAEIEVTFEMFWNGYGKKINRKRSEGLWVKLSKMDQVEAFLAIKEYNKFLQKLGWRSKADPDTYLRDKFYENEYK